MKFLYRMLIRILGIDATPKSVELPHVAHDDDISKLEERWYKAAKAATAAEAGVVWKERNRARSTD